MKKLIGFLTGICAVVLAMGAILCGCSPEIPARPEDTTLEFWIAQDVSDKGYEWEDHYRIPGFGSDIYWGLGYEPVIDEQTGRKKRPDYCVQYTVDAISLSGELYGKRCITEIEITDPAVSIYGLTVESSVSDFNRLFRGKGYRIKTEERAFYVIHKAEKGGFTFGMIEYSDSEKKALTVFCPSVDDEGIIY